MRLPAWILLGAALGAPVSGAATLRVPSGYPTIQAGIDAAAAHDTVLVAPGVYRGAGNAGALILGKDIVLRSEAGPEATIIDAEYASDVRCLAIGEGTTQATVVEGFSLIRGATVNGAGLFIANGSATVRECVIAWNRGPEGAWTTYGGGVASLFGRSRFERCTITANTAEEGAGIWTYDDPALPDEITDTILWGNCVGIDALIWDRSTLRCCDVGYAEGAGALVRCIGSDPRFCDAGPCADPPLDPARFALQPGSPCLPAQNSCGVRIGALDDSGCGAESVPAAPAADPASLRVVPNPSGRTLDCRLRLATPGPVRAEVFDASGRLVARQDRTIASAGWQTLELDLAAGGRALPRGLCLLRMSTPDGEYVRQVVVLD
jgi:hypothetical protein